MKNICKLSKILLIYFLVLLSLFGCTSHQPESCETQKNEEIILGKWENDSFSNEWANYTFTLPDELETLSAEEMQAVNNMLNVTVNGNEDDAQTEIAHTYFDFALKDSNGVICVCAYYVDVYKATYVDQKTSTFAANLIKSFNENYPQYETSEIIPNKIGELDECISFDVFDDYVTITCYIYKKDGFNIVWLVSEYERQPYDINDFLNSVKPIN